MAKDKRTPVEIRTSKRSYTVIGDGRVTWEKGEKVVSIEAKKDKQGGK